MAGANPTVVSTATTTPATTAKTTPSATTATSTKVIESPTARRAKEEAKRIADKYVLPDGSVPTAEVLQSAIADAAKLDKGAYELERRSLAERFGVRLDFLDGAVAEVAEEE